MFRGARSAPGELALTIGVSGAGSAGRPDRSPRRVPPREGRAQAVGTLVHACPLGGPSTQPPGEPPGVPRAPDGGRGSVSTHTCTPSLRSSPPLCGCQVVRRPGDRAKQTLSRREGSIHSGQSPKLALWSPCPGHTLSCFLDVGGQAGGVSSVPGEGLQETPGGLESLPWERLAVHFFGQEKAPERGWQRPGLGSHCWCAEASLAWSTPARPIPLPRPPGDTTAVPVPRLPPSELGWRGCPRGLTDAEGDSGLRRDRLAARKLQSRDGGKRWPGNLKR